MSSGSVVEDATSRLETRVRIAGKQLRAEGVVALELADLDGADLPEWHPGSHIDFVVEGITERQYSLCGDPADRSTWRLGVLLDEAGTGSSRYIHDVLAVGDVVTARGPRNHFALVSSPKYVFVAGGIGITPILPMIREAQAIGAEWRLVYGGRSRATMAFIDELAAYGDRVEIWPQDERGLLDLPGLVGEPLADTLVYCCGPEPLLVAIEEECRGWPPHSLRTERFKPRDLGETSNATFEVVLATSGKTLPVPADKSILEVVRAAGVPAVSSCAEGVCGTCETRVLAGVPDHRDSILEDDERESNETMMICVSRSLTPSLELDL